MDDIPEFKGAFTAYCIKPKNLDVKKLPENNLFVHVPTAQAFRKLKLFIRNQVFTIIDAVITPFLPYSQKQVQNFHYRHGRYSGKTDFI